MKCFTKLFLGSSHLLSCCFVPQIHLPRTNHTAKTREIRKYKRSTAKTADPYLSRNCLARSTLGAPRCLPFLACRLVFASYRMGARFCKFPCLSLPRLLAQSRLRHQATPSDTTDIKVTQASQGSSTASQSDVPPKIMISSPSHPIWLVWSPRSPRYLAERIKKRTDGGRGRGAPRGPRPVALQSCGSSSTVICSSATSPPTRLQSGRAYPLLKRGQFRAGDLSKLIAAFGALTKTSSSSNRVPPRAPFLETQLHLPHFCTRPSPSIPHHPAARLGELVVAQVEQAVCRSWRSPSQSVGEAARLPVLLLRACSTDYYRDGLDV